MQKVLAVNANERSAQVGVELRFPSEVVLQNVVEVDPCTRTSRQPQQRAPLLVASLVPRPISLLVGHPAMPVRSQRHRRLVVVTTSEHVVTLDRRSPLAHRKALRAQPLRASHGQRGRIGLAALGAAGVAAIQPAQMLLAADLTATIITASHRNYGAE